MVVADNRTERLIVRMTVDEKTLLRELSDGEGLSASDYVRQFIRREHAAVFGQSKKPKKK